MKAEGAKANLKITVMLSFLTGVFLISGRILGGTSGMILALILAAVMNLASYWFSDKIVLRMYGAEELSEESNPELHESLKKLSSNAGIPKPKLYKSSMGVPNAFATGRSPKNGVICVTDGLLNKLNRKEVEGVIAHELAHIENRDTLINASVATVAGAISMLAEMAFWGAMFGNDDDMADMAGGAVMMILTPLVAVLVRTAISRKMEFRADSDAVKIQGEQRHLKSALEKIATQNDRKRYKASRTAEAGANMFIYNPFSGHKVTKYFSTHPPLEKRIKNIESTVVD